MSDRTLSAYQRRSSGRQGEVIDAIIERSNGIDTDILAVMDKRDTTMIEEEILHGAGSSKYVYSFRVGTTAVSGISVVGARELATHYGGMQHEIIATVSKVGRLLVITQYPQDGVPMDIRFQRVAELEEEPDFYECLVRIKDIKTGNSTQTRKKELRMEERSDATLKANPGLDKFYARPHYDTIAESKAYRNAVLNLIPQGVQIAWKQKMLELEKSEIITVSVIDEKRSGVLRYAASKAITVDREAVEALTFEQIMGLADAVKEGRVEQFVDAADALGIVIPDDADKRSTRRAVSAPSAPSDKVGTQTRQSGNGVAQTGDGQVQTGQAATGSDAERKAVLAAAQAEQAKRSTAARAGKTSETKRQDGPPAGHPAAGDGEGEKAAALAMKVASASAAQADVDLQAANAAMAGVGQKAKQVETKPAEEEVTGFDHYGLDELGEPVVDADGVLKHFTDPREFALWYNEAFVHSSNQEALKYNNADAREEASLDPAAKVILDAVDNPIDTSKPAAAEEEHAKADEAPQPVALSTLPNNRTNWPKFANDCEASLKTLQSAAEIEAWLVLNGPTYTGKAISARVDVLVKTRREQIAAAPPGDPDLEQAQDLVKRLNETQYSHEYDSILANAAVRSWCKKMSAERQDLRQMVQEADDAAQARTKVRAAPQVTAVRQADAGKPPDEDGIPWDRMGDDPR